MENVSDNIQYLGLIFARVMALFSTAPVLSSEAIRYRVRATLALLLSIILYPVSVNYLGVLPSSPQAYAIAVFGQAFIGVAIGFLMLIVFSAFQIIGEIFSLQMGISFSEVLDPQSQVSLPLLGIFKNSIGILIFMALPFQMDGHYVSAFLHMVRALAHSFMAMPTFYLDNNLQGGILAHIDKAFGLMFVTALKIGIPLIGILFMSSLTLGLLGKAAPQMNLISMGIQINIGVGLLLFIFLVPVIIPLMIDTFVILYDQLGAMLRI